MLACSFFFSFMLLYLWTNSVSPNGELTCMCHTLTHVCHMYLCMAIYGVLVFFIVADKQPVTSGRPTSVRVQTLDRYGKPMYASCVLC